MIRFHKNKIYSFKLDIRMWGTEKYAIIKETNNCMILFEVTHACGAYNRLLATEFLNTSQICNQPRYSMSFLQQLLLRYYFPCAYL